MMNDEGYDNDFVSETTIIEKIIEDQRTISDQKTTSGDDAFSFYAYYCLPYLPSSEFEAVEVDTLVASRPEFETFDQRFQSSISSRTPTNRLNEAVPSSRRKVKSSDDLFPLTTTVDICDTTISEVSLPGMF